MKRLLFLAALAVLLTVSINAEAQQFCICHNVTNTPVEQCSATRTQAVQGHQNHINQGKDVLGKCNPLACGDGGLGCDPNTGVCEECDDDNNTNGDGCSEDCVIEFCGDGTTNNNNEQCDDGNTINGDGCDSNCILEVCGDGVLQGNEQCDDGNTVNGDGCNSTCHTECTNNSQCADNDVCTNDQCVVGVCQNSPNTGNACDDGSLCTQTDSCVSGVCTGSNPVVCAPADECFNDGVCDASTGQCDYDPKTQGSACGDSDFCNGADSCDGQGNCLTGVPPDACDDGEVCTSDSCNPADGNCLFDPVSPGTDCDDSNVCTLRDTCNVDGNCQSGALNPCDDQNSCTDDSCDAASGDPQTGCVNNPNTQNSCSDSDACNGVESCNAQGGCDAGSPLNCDDGDPCTDDSCDAQQGCVNTPNDANSCSDGDACNGVESCNSGTCEVGLALNCDDQNGCTDDSCNPQSGCVNSNNTASCSDGNVCNGAEVCGSGECNSGTPLICNDGNVCTDDSCDPQSGCTVISNTASCDDGLFCNGTDTCSGGSCQHAGDPCVTGSECANLCNEQVDNCLDPQGASCGDSSDTACDNPDSCDGQGNCQSNLASDGTSCSDGDACTESDTCLRGMCTTGESVDCNDSNPCTSDSCSSQSGCLNQPIEGADSTTCGLGVCQNTVVNCSEGTGQVCAPLDAATEETCNGLDDDCDGEVDEGEVCQGGESTACVTDNLPPIPHNLARKSVAGNSIVIPVEELAQDSDSSGQLKIVSATVVGGDSKGTVVMSDGEVEFRSPENPEGETQLLLQVTDGDSCHNPVLANVVIEHITAGGGFCSLIR